MKKIWIALSMTCALSACEEKKPAEPAPAKVTLKAGNPPDAAEAPKLAQWEIDNPIAPLPKAPLGTQADFSKLPWVTPAKVRLGKWLFYDGRLSADGHVPCATCHRPENAFSEPTPHSTGFGGKNGERKSPTFINGAWPLYPFYFWDGRADSLAAQAQGPMANPIEMASSHDKIVSLAMTNAGYKKAFAEVFGDDKIDIGRVAEAIAAYEATRLSGNSKFDKFDAGDQSALSEEEKKGRELFFGKAQCNQCHFGWNFTDSSFHNLGIGWAGGKFKDVGRAGISKKKEDTGAFKTPTLREITKHAPYMHDGSLLTLKDVVEHYNKGGNKNPWLDKKVFKLKLTPQEVDAIVAFMGALEGEGYQDTAPKSFPQ